MVRLVKILRYIVVCTFHCRLCIWSKRFNYKIVTISAKHQSIHWNGV